MLNSNEFDKEFEKNKNFILKTGRRIFIANTIITIIGLAVIGYIAVHFLAKIW